MPASALAGKRLVLAAAALLVAGLRVSGQRVKEYNLWVCPHCERGVKVADVSDLSCEAAPAAPGAPNWTWVKQALYRFLDSLRLKHKTRDMEEMQQLIHLAAAPIEGECYLGIMSLGFYALQFMEPQERYDFMRSTLFGGVTFKRAIPLSYWDVYATGWPIFGLLASAAAVVQRDMLSEGSAHKPGFGVTGIDLSPRGCCDFPRGPANQHDQRFMMALSDNLEGGSGDRVGKEGPLPSRVALEYLAQSAERGCSWGRAAAYFALAEGVLASEGGPVPALQNSTRAIFGLGEHNLDGCEPNVTVHHLMQSVWPFWQVLGRLERRRLRTEQPPPPAGETDDAAAAAGGGSALPVVPEAVRLKWRHFLRTRPPPDPAAEPGVPAALPPPQPVEGCLGANASLVHVALSADLAQVDGLIVALNSATVNAGANASRLCFHAFLLSEDEGFIREALRCAFGAAIGSASAALGGTLLLHNASRLLLHPLNATDVWEKVGRRRTQHGSAGATARRDGDPGDGALKSDTGNLGAVHNFARFLLHELLPGLPRVVYLDVDVVVRGDLCELYDAPLSIPGGDTATIAAVRREHQPLRIYVDVLQPAVPTWVPSEAPSFNAGVLVIDLVRWRERRALQFIAEWIALNEQRRLWLHGTQPPLLLLFHDEIVPLHWAWNVDGLGHRLNYPKEVLRTAKLLHWTGPLKPWRHHGVNRKLWEPYALEYCPALSFREHTTTCRPDSWFC